MKRHFFIALLVMMICTTLTSGIKAESAEFLGLEQIKEDIETYYKEVLGGFAGTLSFLDIRNAEENSNYMYVYFLEDRDPGLAKDIHGNVYSGKELVKVAVYTYSYLTNAWRLQVIKDAQRGLRFKVD